MSTQSELDRPAPRLTLDIDANKLHRVARALKRDYSFAAQTATYWLNLAYRIEIGRVTIEGHEKPMPMRIVAA